MTKTGSITMLECKRLSTVLFCELAEDVLSFVDRDMFMRYQGGGIGHRSLWPLRDILMAEGHLRRGEEWSSENRFHAADVDEDSEEQGEENGMGGQSEDDDDEDEDEDDDEDMDRDEESEDDNDREVGEGEDEEFDEVEDCGYYFEDGGDIEGGEAHIDVAADF